MQKFRISKYFKRISNSLISLKDKVRITNNLTKISLKTENTIESDLIREISKHLNHPPKGILLVFKAKIIFLRFFKKDNSNSQKKHNFKTPKLNLKQIQDMAYMESISLQITNNVLTKVTTKRTPINIDVDKQIKIN